MLNIAKRFVFLLVLLPFTAFAEEAPAIDTSSALIAGIIAFAAPLLLQVIRLFLKDKTDARMRIVAMAIDVAYHATTNAAKYTTTKVDDKIAFALGELKKVLDANGYLMTADDAQMAQVKWAAMHAVEKQGLAVTAARP